MDNAPQTIYKIADKIISALEAERLLVNHKHIRSSKPHQSAEKLAHDVMRVVGFNEAMNMAIEIVSNYREPQEDKDE